MTTHELAGRIDLDDQRTAELLEELEDDGLVEYAGGWRLTASAESRFGRALRVLALPELDADGSPAARCANPAGLDLDGLAA